MSLYFVVSETLYEKIPIFDFGEGPLEPYSIVELVCAHSREQARYLAWQNDRRATKDFQDCPNFRTRKLSNNPDAKGIVTEWSNYREYWSHPKVLELLHSANTSDF